MLHLKVLTKLKFKIKILNLQVLCNLKLPILKGFLYLKIKKRIRVVKTKLKKQLELRIIGLRRKKKRKVRIDEERRISKKKGANR